MQLPEPCSKLLEDQICLVHCRIDLAAVAKVKKQSSLRELLEDVRQFSGCSSCQIPLVHILDEKKICEHAPSGRLIDRVRVKNDWHSPFKRFRQHVNDFLLEAGL